MRSSHASPNERPEKAPAVRATSRRRTQSAKSTNGQQDGSDSTPQPEGRRKTGKKTPLHADRTMPLSDQELETRIATRAYELYEHRGKQHGHDLEDWIQAAREILTSKA